MTTALKTARPIVTLTTDFGTGSSYVAQMKGVLLARNPDLHIVDVSHDIPPHDLQAGAIMLEEVSVRFPPRTIHVAVVDPGVGTNRDIVYVKCGEQQYIAPNNGLLTHVVARAKTTIIRAVTNRLYFLPNVSATFHGRDIIAPVAAHLSLGLKPARLGLSLESLVMLKTAEPVVEPQGIVGSVIYIDRFGNVMTNISASHLSGIGSGKNLRISCRNREIKGLSRTYGDQEPGALIALIGSGERLEMAVVQGRASDVLGSQAGDEVRINW